MRPGIDLIPAAPVLGHRLLHPGPLHHAPPFSKANNPNGVSPGTEQSLQAYISGSGMAWSTRRNPVDDTFAYHDYRRMGSTRPGDARHHRRISHPQSCDALDPAVLVNDRQRICIRSHLAGPGYVPGGTRGLTYPEIQSVVIGQNVFRRVDP